MNVGASRPEDAGLYFSWGNVEGVSADDAEAVAAMTEAAYANTHGASINHDLLDDTEDAAIAIMGVNWCMPDDEDIQELIDECDWEWVTINGVNGYRISSKKPGNTNSIFLPTAGQINNGILEDVGRTGSYYSSSIQNGEAWNLSFDQNNAGYAGTTIDKFIGCTIRARLA